MSLTVIENALEAEALEELKELMTTKFQIYLKDRSFEISTLCSGHHVEVKVVLENGEQDYHYPVEARVQHKTEGMSKEEAALFLIDYIDMYFEDFFEGQEEVLLPIDWTDTEYDAIPFQIKGQILNLKLERMADEWLSSSPVHQELDIQ